MVSDDGPLSADLDLAEGEQDPEKLQIIQEKITSLQASLQVSLKRIKIYLLHKPSCHNRDRAEPLRKEIRR